jgi:hypothetical protein
VEHRVWPGQMHVFQALTLLMTEATAALDHVGEFVQTHLPDVPEHAHLRLAASA